MIPSGVLGGFLWEFVSPAVSFTIASAGGLVGVVYVTVFGQEFEAYA